MVTGLSRRRRVLKAFGWTMISVPYYDWYGMDNPTIKVRSQRDKTVQSHRLILHSSSMTLQKFTCALGLQRAYLSHRLREGGIQIPWKPLAEDVGVGSLTRTPEHMAAVEEAQQEWRGNNLARSDAKLGRNARLCHIPGPCCPRHPGVI